MLRRHKYILIALGVYWPVVFALTHIPVPQIAAQSGMSDKTMHVMAYFALTFLIWCAVSPYRRVQWNTLKPWIVVGVIFVYGIVDETVQAMVGRQAEVNDFLANLFGMVFAMGIAGIFRFWSALLAVMTVGIFIVSNMSRLTMLYPQYYLNTAFYYAAYAGLTLVWIQHMEQHMQLDRRRSLWSVTAAAMPLTLLAAVMTAGLYWGKTIWPVDAATAVFGILSAIIVSRLTLTFSKKQSTL